MKRIQTIVGLFAIIITQISQKTVRITDTTNNVVCYQTTFQNTVAISCVELTK